MILAAFELRGNTANLDLLTLNGIREADIGRAAHVGLSVELAVPPAKTNRTGVEQMPTKLFDCRDAMLGRSRPVRAAATVDQLQPAARSHPSGYRQFARTCTTVGIAVLCRGTRRDVRTSHSADLTVLARHRSMQPVITQW